MEFRNNLALKHMRNMKKGDQVIYYHTGDERQAVGVMSVITNPYPNPEEDNDRFVVVNVKFKKKIPKTCFIRTDEKRKILQKLGVVKDWKVISNACAKKHLGQDYQNDPIKVMKNYSLIDISHLDSNYMATAYVLINCELGSEEAILQQLKSIDGVKESHGTFGAYDILTKVESSTVEALRETITWKIRKN